MQHKIYPFFLLGVLTLLAFPTNGEAKKKALIRTPDELIVGTRIWIEQIEAVKVSGKTLRIRNTSTKSQKRLARVVGPYVPLDKVSFVEIRPDGTASMTFTKKHIIDIPEGEGYIRVTVLPKTIKVVLIDATTTKNKTPVKVLAFLEPRTLVVDKLDLNRKSTIPALGKLLGLLPHIIALAFRETKDGDLVALQLDGLGAKENGRLIRELLKVDDTLLPEYFLESEK